MLPLHIARRQGGVDRLPVHAGGLAAGILERVHLAVEDRPPLLDAAVVAAAEDPPLVDEHRADGNAAFGEASLRLLDRRAQELVR
jgi:hypothetical protein